MMSLSLEEQLNGHPIKNNEDLWNFNVPSRNIFWNGIVKRLSTRGEPRVLGRNFTKWVTSSGDPNRTVGSGREVLVCHDLMGNYRHDRLFAGSKKWDDYRFYHWSGIDYFCYFSHEYITIPPYGWICAAHSHGVRVLGTFITEHGKGSELLKEVLQSHKTAELTVDALILLCEHFCFEGWLINIECPVDSNQMPILLYFLEELTKKIHSRIPAGIVFWYDSIIENGNLAWQNELNTSNIKFFNVCDAILINYTWSDVNLANTSRIVEETNPSRRTRIFMGIDIFGRGQVAGLKTHTTLQRVVEKDFSVGIFAPGWTFESLNRTHDVHEIEGAVETNRAFMEKNEEFWHSLWSYLRVHPIVELPFFTTFCLGSGEKNFNLGFSQNEKFFNISKQAIQPSVPLRNYVERWFADGLRGGSCLRIIRPNEIFRLYSCDFPVRRTLVFGYASKLGESEGQLDCVLKVRENADPQRVCEIFCGSYPFYGQEGRIYLSALDDHERITLHEILRRERTSIQLPFNLPNGWTMRYFLGEFDRPIHVLDIGCILRLRDHRVASSPNIALLGAIYLHTSYENVVSGRKLSLHSYFV